MLAPQIVIVRGDGAEADWSIFVSFATAEFEKPPENVGERSSLAFVQLEKHNERLKEALIRSVTSVSGRTSHQRDADVTLRLIIPLQTARPDIRNGA